MYQGAVQNRGLTGCGHSRLQFGSVRGYCNIFRIAGPLLRLPILSAVWKGSVMIIMSGSTEVTWSVSVCFLWCQHWFAPFFSCFWYSWWYLLVAAWKAASPNWMLSDWSDNQRERSPLLAQSPSKCRETLQQDNDTFLPSSSLQEQPSEGLIINCNWIYWIVMLFPSSSIFHSTLFSSRIA